nr:immunoglobulin heavy chain junction region [Macaca mulatta]MOX94488.1 immunoglobulin heavy chain junction region [Macaca mulatta]MOX94596.1 immunoglobulin heavy chain junction region [Macaca mulatta]MOX95063.1 immunoglobulin heavy chain junction region [Macaca mulatta]MOX96049.1 immunoglobulin heavy chain junction region [Macaca mulatta]
CVRRQSNLDSW